MKTYTTLGDFDMEIKSQISTKQRLVALVSIFLVSIVVWTSLHSNFGIGSVSSPTERTDQSKRLPAGAIINRITQFPWGTDGTLSEERYQGTKRLPGALVIGAKKAGTRALLEFIRVHPNVRAAGHEIHYFDKNYSLGPEWYREMMPTTIHGQITMEKTPSYMVTEDAPERVYEMNRDMKLVVILKDPVERAISDFTQSNTKHRQKRSFESSVFKNLAKLEVNDTKPSIRNGLYSRHLKHWFKYFPLDQFCFISGENLVKNPATELKKLQKFLQLKIVITEEHFYFNSTKGFPCLKKREASGVPHCLGEGKGRVHPKVLPSAKRALYNFFEPYNTELYRMIGIDFNWERRNPATLEPSV